MGKDSKGHGSEKKNGSHEWHAAESQRLLKDRAGLLKAGDKRGAADHMVKAREHAEEANYLRSKERGKTPAAKADGGPKYNAASVDKAIDSAYRGKKPPSAQQRAVTHGLLSGGSKAINSRGDTFKPKAKK